nr:DUF982 domain-containing protein [Mesorhizobium sp.]
MNYRWPKGTGKKHRSARKACLDVLSGLRKPIVARQALTEVAR